MIGSSAAFRAVLQQIDKLAIYDAPVLIDGETGTGKELAARAIHYGSQRRERPFVPVNCGAIPDSLFENELFGHARGAFTDAREEHQGLVGLAHRGTLFLDEVDALSSKGQVALLRFLQDQQYRPLGGREQHQADVRIVAASNRSLDVLSESRAFRSDLLYRLRILQLEMPALRERRGDAALLADHFVQAGSRRFGKPPLPFAAATLTWFDEYQWPGNVRQLENLVYRELLLAEGEEIEVAAPGGNKRAESGTHLSYRQAKAQAIERFEREFLLQLMARAQGCVTTAARMVRTERRHLGRLLKRHGIDTSSNVA